MWYLAILVAFGVSIVNGQAVFTLNCVPALISNTLPGATTATTFTIQNPCCITQDSRILPTDRIVYVVGTGDGINSLSDINFDFNNPPLFSNFTNTGFFAAYNGLVGNLCPSVGSLNTGIRFGENVLCLINGNIQYCNAPLPSVGPYSVTGLIFRDGTLIGRTGVSAAISLRNPKDFNSIDTSRKKRSADMIIITTILPILFALLLVLFTCMLFMRCCCFRVFTPKQCQES